MPWRIVAVLSAGLAAACSNVDVCERSWPREFQLNQLTDGAQKVSGYSPLAAWPDGESLLAFQSDASVLTSIEQPGLRGVRFGPSGETKTCDQPSEATFTRIDEENPVRNTFAALVPPLDGTTFGLLAFASYREASGQILVQQLSSRGCAHDEAPPFQVSAETAGFACEEQQGVPREDRPHVRDCLKAPVSARLGANTFVILWQATHEEGEDVEAAVRGRVIETDYFGPKGLRTSLSAGDAPGELTSLGGSVRDLAVVALRGGVFGLGWQDNSHLDTVATKLRIFDTELRPTTDLLTVHESENYQVVEPSVRLAVNGSRILVAWIGVDDDHVPRVFARSVTAKNSQLVFPPGSSPGRRLSETECGAETRVAITPLRSSRAAFLVAWQAAGCSNGQPTIRAIVLDRDGNSVFSNRACDAADFGLVTTAPGGQSSPALATNTDGSIAVAWTQDGFAGSGDRGGSDRSKSSVRGTVIDSSALIPEPL